jgi:putative transposase
MPRASRHYIPGYVWHITHRCHKKEFLLKFARDRNRWLYWLFEAKKRFGLSILNYTVTSNHIHLLVRDSGPWNTIPKAIQLIAGRTGQEFNQRKGRKGAFWEDRYHATAIETDKHLFGCMVYIDLNMVRAGVVQHPSEWTFCGYSEIQKPRQRYALIDYDALKKLLGFEDMSTLALNYRDSVEKILNERWNRDAKWSESIAVGGKSFVAETKDRLGVKVKGRKIIEGDGGYELRDPSGSYNAISMHEKAPLSFENSFKWDNFDNLSIV